MVKKVSSKKVVEMEEDYSLNDVLLRGRVSNEAVEKELPSGDKVVEFRLIVTRDKQPGVDTLDIGSWSAKSRRTALSLAPDEWVEIQAQFIVAFGVGQLGLQVVGRLKRWRFHEFR